MFFRFCILPKTCLGDIFQEVHTANEEEKKVIYSDENIHVTRSDQKIIPFMAKKKAETPDKSSISAS